MCWTPWVHIQTDLRSTVSELWQVLLLTSCTSVLVCFGSFSKRTLGEKCWILKPSFRQKKTHGDAFLLVWKIPGTYQLGWDSENPFLTAPPELSRSIINYSRRCTQEMWGSACLLSSFPHDLSNIRHFNSSDSTVINVLISIFPPRCLCCLSYALIIN